MNRRKYRRVLWLLILVAVVVVLSSHYEPIIKSPSRPIYGRTSESEQTHLHQVYTVPLDELSSPDNKKARDAWAVRELQIAMKQNYEVDYWRSSRADNDEALERLAFCLETQQCDPDEEVVVILASFHFGYAKLGMVSGEDIWALSMIESITALNHTLVYTYGHMDTLLVYQHLPDLVKIIIWEGEQLQNCIQRNETNFFFEKEESHTPGDWQTGQKGCIRKADFPDGIPIWKSFAFHFWTGSSHPLGSLWTLSPYDYGKFGKGNNYIGYSIEAGCERQPFQGSKERLHRAIVLGKRPAYFAPDKIAWPDMLPAVGDNIRRGKHGEEFGFLAVSSRGTDSDVITAQGIETAGTVSYAAWFAVIGQSKVMLGIGEPYLSPSPYDALCQGVPFINVIKYLNEDNPDDRSQWHTQHDALRTLSPPYVYHVMQHDQSALQIAIQEAIDNPIPSFIPPEMTRDALRDRIRNFVHLDWKRMGEAKIEQLLQKGQSDVFLA